MQRTNKPREASISSSKINTIMGLNMFKTMEEQFHSDLRYKTTGESTPPEFTAKAQQKIKMGALMENTILELAEKQWDVHIQKGENDRYCHDDNENFTIEFDGLDYDNEETWEAKNTEQDEAHLLKQYYAQVQWNLFISGWNVCNLVYLQNGWYLGRIRIERDDEFIDKAVRIAEYYLECLEAEELPDWELIKDVVNEGKEEDELIPEVEPDEDDMELLYKLAELKAIAKVNKRDQDEVLSKLGHITGTTKTSDFSFTRKEETRKGAIDTKALLMDYPDLNLDLYRKPDSTYMKNNMRISKAYQERIDEENPSKLITEEEDLI